MDECKPLPVTPSSPLPHELDSERCNQRRGIGPANVARHVFTPLSTSPLELDNVAYDLAYTLNMSGEQCKIGDPKSAGPYAGIFSLSGPITARFHVQVGESSGSSRGSRGSRGSRLSMRALGGISLRFAPFLPGRHSEI